MLNVVHFWVSTTCLYFNDTAGVESLECVLCMLFFVIKGKGRFRLGPGGGAGDPSLPRERMQGGLEKGDDIHRIYPYISRYCPRPRITGDKV